MSLNYKSIAAAGIGFGIIAVASQGFITPELTTYITTKSVSGADSNTTRVYSNLRSKRDKQNELDDEEVLIQLMTTFLNTRPRT